MADSTTISPWWARGLLFENCSCTLVCPGHMHFSQNCTHERCKGYWAIRVDDGLFDRTALAGTRAVVAFDTPQRMIDGGWLQTIIIDDFAPHAWQGASTCADWWNALAADSKKRGITEPKVTLGKAWHITVTGDRAYAVYSTHYDYKLNGKPTTEQGVWTFALQKMADGWRIAGWAWAQH